jgi:predicted lactoylglutathione lyase
MLLTHDKFRQFTSKRIADPRDTVEALFALSLDSREGVDEITQRALAAGGSEIHGAEDLGWMYSRGFEDPDGHGWGPLWMDAEAAAQAMAAAADA